MEEAIEIIAAVRNEMIRNFEQPLGFIIREESKKGPFGSYYITLTNTVSLVASKIRRVPSS
ncbi:MAG TPA: hypothetical protein P5160_06185 [Candidatus Omnitrophota bacterium]|nr:hypothetical protein [Candidatus Omnitrophota bacterium]